MAATVRRGGGLFVVALFGPELHPQSAAKTAAARIAGASRKLKDDAPMRTSGAKSELRGRHAGHAW